jgi:hypothetical protein
MDTFNHHQFGDISLIQVIPLNAAAESADVFTRLRDGLLVKDGYSSAVRRYFRNRRVDSVDGIIQPYGKERHVIFTSEATPKHTELLLALKEPVKSALPVFEILPAGRTMHRLSQVALGLGAIYLAFGLFAGVALPTGLQWVGQYYGGLSTTFEERQRMRKVITEFQVFRERVVDEKTQKFFKALTDAKLGNNK